MHPITKHIVTSSVIAFITVILLSIYTVIRHQTFDMYMVNKILAGTSVILLGIVVITGAFGRIYNFFDRMLMYRKWLGIAAFITGYAHGIMTLFFLPERFPASRFHLGNNAFVFGLISMMILGILFVYSFQITTNSLNRKLWWKLQYWGVRLAFIAGLIHVLLVKYGSWQRWITGQETSMIGSLLPPAGLIITVFLLYVICVRIAEIFGKHIATKVIMASTILMGLMWLGLVLNGIYNVVNV